MKRQPNTKAVSGRICGLAALLALVFASASVVSGAPGPAPAPQAPQISVAISPGAVGLTVSQSVTLTATVTNDSSGKGVTWSVSGSGCSGNACGTLSAATSTTVKYTAPAIGGAYTVTATSVADVTRSATATIGVTDLPGVYTYRNDYSRSSVNSKEYILTPSNVNASSFGKLFACTVDGAVYAQPLWVANVAIGGGTHNIVIVATQNDSVYAFDADNGNGTACTQYWKASMLLPAYGAASGATPVPAADTGETGDILTQIGITATPVIDPTTNILYVLSKTKENDSYFQRLHKLVLATGAEMSGAPVALAASVSGSGSGSTGGTLAYSALHQNPRPGLALVNGSIYISSGSHGDNEPWHGWILQYNAASLAFTGAYCSTPNTNGGGIWMSGSAPVFDSSNNLYVITSNGTYDGNTEFGDSFLRLTTTSGLSLADWFTPDDELTLASSNGDLGAGGAITLLDSVSGPYPHLLIGGGKEGVLYLVNRDLMGHYNSQSNGATVQTWQVAPNLGNYGGVSSSGEFWQNTFYIAGSDEPLEAFAFNTAKDTFNVNPTSQSNVSFGFPGITPAISSEGTANGIVWGIDTSTNGTNGQPTGPAVLYAFDASNLANELWDSTQLTSQGASNQAANAVKFAVPTVANGKVYVAAVNTLDVYGLLSQGPSVDAPTFSPAPGAYTSVQTVSLADTTSGATIYYTLDGSAPTTSSAVYSTPINISGTTTINAMAAATGLNNSTVAAGTYTIQGTGAAISYVQGNYATPQSATTTVNVAFTNAQFAGDLNVIVVGWNDSSHAVSSVTDSKGNLYTLAVGPTLNSTGGLSQSIYYAKAISAAAAGGNTVTVAFNGATAYPDIRILEYTGADPATPVDIVAAATGFSTSSSVTTTTPTTNASDLLFGANIVLTNTTGPGSGFITRMITQPDSDIAEDRMVSATGTYTASASLSSGQWIMQVVAFRAAGGSGGDTTPPSAPSNPTATPAAPNQINLSWTASTDNVGVTGYLVERCQAAGCTSFAQIGTSATNSYGDTTLLGSTSYSYRVRATDAAGNLSPYSNVVSATTPADTTPPTTPTNLTPTPVSSTEIDLSWTASTDNVGVTNYFVQRCQGAGCTNFAQVSAPRVNSVDDTGLTPSTTYNYRIQATDFAGNLSGFSSVVTATTLSPTPPTAPSNLTGPGPLVQTPQGYYNSTSLTTHTTAPFDSTGGDAIVVFASSHNGVTMTPSDSFNNTWISLTGPTNTTAGFDLRSQVWYAKNPIVGTGQTFTLNLSIAQPLVMAIFVVKGSNIPTPIDVFSPIGDDGGTQTLNVTSPSVTSTFGNDLLIGFAKSSVGETFTSGTGFTPQPTASSNYLDAETELVAPPGTYDATFTLNAAATWQAEVVAIDPAVSAASASQIPLSWTASTDDIGVTGYFVERCEGIGCTNFVQIASTSTTIFTDTGLTASTTYNYRVRATDAAGSLSAYSNTLSASTQASSLVAPTVSSISPNNGPATGGTAVTITGTNFAAGATVTIGGTAATSVVVVNSTTITATTPAHAAGAATVAVTVNNQSGSLTSGFTYVVPATVSSVSPNTGSTTGGTAVTITGTNFAAGATVTLGAAAATSVVVVNSTTITATTPAGSAGAVTVTVTNPGLSGGSLTNGFTYVVVPTVSSISPNNGPATGGTAVTITGTNFAAGATVTIGGTAATSVVVVNSTTITATTPAHAAGAATVAVTVNNQSGSLTNGYTFNSTVAIGYAQVASSTPQSPTATVTVAYPGAQTAGDLNIVVVGWNDTTAAVQTVKDSAGNTYSLAIGPTAGTALQQSIYYASGIVGGSNTVTVTFNQAAAYPDVRILEYKGVTTLDAKAGASGNSAAANSGAATTTSASELIFGANTVYTGTGAAGSGFTSRVITPDGDIAEDEVTTATGSYSATATLTSAGPWVMQMATFAAILGPAPAVSGVTPNTGSTSGGTSVTITGANFAVGATVTIGGTAATSVVVNSTTITATTPAHAAGAATVTVTVNGQNGSLTNGFTYVASPTVSSISPNNGPATGGTAVTITGTNFAAGATVTIGGTAATSVVVVNSTTITATTPAHAAGAATVAVTVNNQSGSLTSGFTYVVPATVSSVSPNTGSTTGGTAVTITGTNFAAGATVTLGAAAATSVVVVNSTTITATTPAGSAGAVTVTVTNPGLSGGSLTNGFTYVVVPTVSSISPNNGPATGGTAVTITGTNFAAGATVTIGGTAATSVVVVNSTTITATTPAHAAGAATVAVTVNNQSGSLTNGYTFNSTVAIGYAQVASSTPQSPTATVTVAYPGAQTAGDLNIVVVGWNDTTAAVQTVKDSAGNTYSLAIGPTAGTALQQSIYYASGIVGGSNTVTVTFNQAAAYPDVRILEYKGVTTLDAKAGASGNSAAANSGAATTTSASELIFGANTVYTGTGAAGSGFTSRVITPDGDIAEDEVTTATGSYSATATLTSAGPWVMQMVTFK